MNSTFEVSLNNPLDPKDVKLNPKRSFAFDKDITLILTSLGSNHLYLAQWQANRKTLYSTHMSILETIYQRVCQESDISIQKTEFLIEFLRSKSLQIHKFASVNQKLIAFRKQSLEISAEMKSSLDPFSDIWGNMDFIHTNLQKKNQQLSTTIEQTLLKSILLEEQRDFTSVLSKYKVKVSSGKKRLEKLDQETDLKFASYSRVYDDLIKDISIKKKVTPKKSLYLFEHEFLSMAFDHEKLFQEFSITMIDFFKEFWHMQESKIERINLALTKYYEEFTCMFRSQRDFQILQDLIKEIEPKKICKQMFQLTNLLSEEQMLKTIKNVEGTLKDVETFIRGFKLEEIVESELILGKFMCMRQMNKNKTKEQKSWIDGMAIITKDSWLLLINDVKDMYKEPEYLMDLRCCSFNDRSEEMIVAINEKNKGWCKKDSVHWIKLDSNDDREYFLELLKGGKPKTFKTIEQTPQINSIFHDLVNLTAKILETKLTKLETSNQKTVSSLEDLKDAIHDLSIDLQNLQSEDSLSLSKPKKEPVSLSNEIKQYFKKREKTIENAPYETSSPEKQRLPSPRDNNLNNVGYNNAVLKNSSSYKDFVQMMDNVPVSNTTNGERKKSPPAMVQPKEKPKPKEIEEKSEQTPKNKTKNNKKIYQYYVNSTNERKLNGLISDSQARNNKEATNGNKKEKQKLPRKNTNVRKKEIFQKELAKNYTVLASKSKEKLIVSDEGEIIDSNRTQKIGENIQKKISAKSTEERVERGNEKTLKNGTKSNQQSVSCERTHEESKMKSPSSSSSKFLNYYYFFDKNKEIIQVEGEN